MLALNLNNKQGTVPPGRAARLDVRRAQLEGDVQRAAVAARDRDAAMKARITLYYIALLFFFILPWIHYGILFYQIKKKHHAIVRHLETYHSEMSVSREYLKK